MGWEQLGCDRGTWPSPCPHRKVTRMWPACLPPILGQKRGEGCSPQQVTGPGETEARVPLPHFCPPPAPHWPSSHRLGESEAQMAELDPWPGDAPAMLSPCPHILSRCQHAPGKVGCTGWVLSPPGVRGGCCDPLRGWGCGHLGSPPSPQVPPGATPGQRARLGGSVSAAETSLGPFPPGWAAWRGSDRWVNAALLPPCPQKPALAFPGTKWERAHVPDVFSLRQVRHACKPPGSCNLSGRFLSCLALLSRVMRRR